MRRVWNIAMLVVVALVTALAVSCSNETDTTLNTQQNNIQRYLTGSHSPKLIAEEDIATSLDDEPAFYTHWGLDIFRYIATYYDEGRDSKPALEAGDKAEIYYTAYIFTNGKPTYANMFATNQQEAIEYLENQGLTPSTEWSTDPYIITLGNGDILESLETALEGCREGDAVEVYLTFEAGYGNKPVGMVDPKSSLMWEIKIHSVTKKQ